MLQDLGTPCLGIQSANLPMANLPMANRSERHLCRLHGYPASDCEEPRRVSRFGGKDLTKTILSDLSMSEGIDCIAAATRTGDHKKNES